MSNTQERIQKRREYLKKKRAAYAKLTLAILFAWICLQIAFMLFHRSAKLAFTSQPFFAFILLVLSCLIAVPVVIFAYFAHLAHKEVHQLPYIPPVTAETLPAEEVLVRESEEPTQEQSQVLLRGTNGSAGTAEQELLRGSQGQEDQV